MTKIWLSLICAIMLAACEPKGSVQNTSPEISQSVSNAKLKTSETLVGRVNGREITLAQLDEPLRVALFDTKWQTYQLRKDQLKNLVKTLQQEHNASGSSDPFSAELFLEPPFPPRLVLPVDQRPIKGDSKAPVRLSVFCSYQSSHCVRLQPALEKIENHYGQAVSFSYYDFPQGFHRYARGAANAVRCAADQQSESDVKWDFQSSIYGASDDLKVKRFTLIGEQLGLDQAAFKTCLSQKKFADAIDQDVDLSKSLGFNSVPIVLINGLYVKGTQSFSAYKYYIDGELARLNVKRSKALELKKSKLPLRLQGTFVQDVAEESRAIVKLIDTGHVQTYYQGDSVLEQVILVEVLKDRVIIDNDGKPEYILMQQSLGEAGSDKTSSNDASDSNSLRQNHPDRIRPAPEDRVLRDKSKIVLLRSWLNNQLAQQATLAEHFKPGEHKASGFNLMKLEDVDDNEFYETLGLKSGDVIMQVNDEWLHSGQNPLWNALGLTDSIAVTVMRSGRPVRYYYRVKE